MSRAPTRSSEPSLTRQLAPQCPLGPIAFAASLQLGFSTPNFLICEMSLQMHYNKGDFDLLTYLK